MTKSQIKNLMYVVIVVCSFVLGFVLVRYITNSPHRVHVTTITYDMDNNDTGNTPLFMHQCHTTTKVVTTPATDCNQFEHYDDCVASGNEGCDSELTYEKCMRNFATEKVSATSESVCECRVEYNGMYDYRQFERSLSFEYRPSDDETDCGPWCESECKKFGNNDLDFNPGN